MACGGKAEGDGRDPGDGDGDGHTVSGPVGEAPDYIGTGGGGWVGALPTGGTFIGGTGGWVGTIGTGGIPEGTGGYLVGTGGAFIPGEPPYLGGMGGTSDDEEETVGQIIR